MLWIEDAALACRQITGPGGQARYTAAAIQTSLMLRTAFKPALRQTESLMTSVLRVISLSLSVLNHTKVSRRVVLIGREVRRHADPKTLMLVYILCVGWSAKLPTAE